MTTTDLWQRFRLNGTQRELTGEVNQTEQLEGWVTTTATVELAGDPTFTEGDAVDIYQVDFNNSTTVPQFAGQIDNVNVTAEPNIVSLLLRGPLHKLFRATMSGLNLTGMTDGEAWMAVADHVNLDYDPADIEDTGYVLGAHVPVKWKRETDAWQMIRELDRVFGMTTIEIENGRVIRFPYDRVPNASEIVASYTVGNYNDLIALGRRRWGLSEIKNAWEVRGATWEDSKKCRLTPWAKSQAANASFETAGVRVRRETFTSDLIQDESLAIAIVERLMRWWNRSPDHITITVDNDPRIHPGHVIGVMDELSFGMSLMISPATNPFVILTVDRNGEKMTLSCVGGTAGATGTVTSGVERRCNKELSNTGLDDLYTAPLMMVPPLYVPDPYVCLSFGGPGGVCPEAEDPHPPFVPYGVSWINSDSNPVGEDWTIAGSTITTSNDDNVVALTTTIVPGRTAELPISHKVEFTIKANTVNDHVEVFGEGDGPLEQYFWWFRYFNDSTGILFMTGSAYWGTSFDDILDFGLVTPGASVAVTIEWDADTRVFTVTVGANTQTVTASDDEMTQPLRFSAINGGFVGATGTSISTFTITEFE